MDSYRKKQVCPNCKHMVFTLYSNRDNPVNGGLFNMCEFCTDKEVLGLHELNEARKLGKLGGQATAKKGREYFKDISSMRKVKKGWPKGLKRKLI